MHPAAQLYRVRLSEGQAPAPAGNVPRPAGGPPSTRGPGPRSGRGKAGSGEVLVAGQVGIRFAPGRRRPHPPRAPHRQPGNRVRRRPGSRGGPVADRDVPGLRHLGCRGPGVVLCAPTPGRCEAAARTWDGCPVCPAVGDQRARRPCQAGVFDCDWPPWVRSCSLMRWASSSWSSRMTMRQAASMGVPWSTSSRARAAMRSW